MPPFLRSVLGSRDRARGHNMKERATQKPSGLFHYHSTLNVYGLPSRPFLAAQLQTPSLKGVDANFPMEADRRRGLVEQAGQTD